MAECTGLESVVASLREVCHGQCPTKKKQIMKVLEEYQSCDNYLESLVRIIDVGDVGASISVESRHLAAVLLKNIVCKRGKLTEPAQPLRAQTHHNTTVRPLHAEERKALKSFLVRYQQEPSCKVAVQLSLVAAKITRQDGEQWLQEWPELMPALVTAIKAGSFASGEPSGRININDPLFIRGMRGVSTLSEVLTEMSTRASTASSSSTFGKTFSVLCAQLYPHIGKAWGQNMRLFQEYIGKLNTQAESTNFQQFGTSVTGVTQAELESLIVQTILLSKVMRVVLEFGIEQICVSFTTFFKSFFKCYMGGLRILVDFVRKYRPFCASLRQASNGYANCDCSKIFSSLLVCMKNQIMCDEDCDDMCDAYIPLDCAQGNNPQSELLSLLNLTLKLIKSSACAPVILQRKHPLLVVPTLNCMLEYYNTFLLEEYRGMAAQKYELSVLELGVGSAVPSQLTVEQRHQLYSAQFVRDALPLNYLVKASGVFMANVLSCADYAEHNMYSQPTPTPEENISLIGDISLTPSSNCSCSNMEESADIKRDVSGALEVRNAFFSTSRITQLIHLLVYPMLTYNEKELAIWAECPEEFVLSQERSCEGQVSSVKYAAERLLTALFEFAPDTVCALLCPMLMDCRRQEALLAPLPGSMPCMKQQYFLSRELKIYDAVYVCAGLGVAYMGPYMTQLKRQCLALGQPPCPGSSGNTNTGCEEEGASHWVREYLGPMVEQLLLNPSAGCIYPGKQQLLRSRLVWLLSVWMDKFDRAVLPHVLNILIDFIALDGSDVVVKMNAIHALQAVINLEIFDISDLKCHVVKAMEALCLFVCKLQESDCKITVLEVAGEFISLLSVQLTALKPLVVPLAGYLENLWSETTDPSQHAIIDVMSALVKASKHHAASILPTTLRLITISCTTHLSSTREYCPNDLREIVCPFQRQQRQRRHSKGGCGGNGNGFLVRDGVALWLSVMRNLTEQLYVQHFDELQELFLAVMQSMRLLDTAREDGVLGDWDLSSDPECAEITQDLMLVLEAYGLLGGESHSLLRNPRCQACITVLYCATLGKVEARLVQFSMRPLHAFLLSCPVLAGQFLTDACVLVEILRKCMATVACPNLKNLFIEHKESDVALISYLTLIAQLMIFNPSALLSAVMVIKTDVLSYVRATTGVADEKILTEGILVAELVNLMFSLFSSLAHSPAPTYKSKLWCLALLSLFPPTVLDNRPMIPPGVTSSHTGTSPRMKPDCMIGRTMLMIMNSMHFNLGRAKLEQYQRAHCSGQSTHTASAAPSEAEVDYLSLSFWYPSILNEQQLYSWVEPIVRICKGALKQEKSKKHRKRMSEELLVLISGNGEESGGLCFIGNDDSESDLCDDIDTEEEDEGENKSSTDVSMKAAEVEEEVVMGVSITAQDGDSLRLDVAEEPLVQVYKTRMFQSGLLKASIESHITEKFIQLRKALGDERFLSIQGVRELDL